MTTTTIEKGYPWPIEVTEEQLRRLCIELKEALTKARLEIPSLNLQLHFSDDSSTTLSTVDDVVKEENPRGKSIVGLDIEASVPGNHVIVQIGENGGAFSIEGQQREWVYLTSSFLEERLRRMRLPYLRSPIMGWGAAMLGALIALRFVVHLSERTTPSPWLVFLIGALFIAGFGFPTLWFFPSPVFRLGSGIKRQETVEKMRLLVFRAFLTTVVFGTLYRFVTILFGDPLAALGRYVS